MTYTGMVKQGVIVLEAGSAIPDGTVVRVEEVTPSIEHPPWAEVFKDLIGAAEGLPVDMADNHDHYIHGAERK